jgi:LysR family transcriptional regulator, hydrogen peroxide-inducible genes activator
MNLISMRHLRYFAALSRHLHFGRAAEACAISQPALSVQMRELEELLGVALIERRARQVSLTSFGEAFALRARAVLRSVDELQDLARASLGTVGGVLRLGTIPTIAPYLLPHVIQDLAQRFPALDIRPREARTRQLLDHLREGSLDVAIVALPLSEPSLHEQFLFDEAFVLVRPEKDKDLPVPSTEALKTMRLLLLEEGHCFRDQALAFCKVSPTVPRDLFEGHSLTTLVQMVNVGIGVTLIPDMAVAIETRSSAVSVTRFSGAAPRRSIGMVWRRSDPLAMQFAAVADCVRSTGLKLQSTNGQPDGGGDRLSPPYPTDSLRTDA